MLLPLWRHTHRVGRKHAVASLRVRYGYRDTGLGCVLRRYPVFGQGEARRGCVAAHRLRVAIGVSRQLPVDGVVRLALLGNTT